MWTAVPHLQRAVVLRGFRVVEVDSGLRTASFDVRDTSGRLARHKPKQ